MCGIRAIVIASACTPLSTSRSLSSASGSTAASRGIVHLWRGSALPRLAGRVQAMQNVLPTLNCKRLVEILLKRSTGTRTYRRAKSTITVQVRSRRSTRLAHLPRHRVSDVIALQQLCDLATLAPNEDRRPPSCSNSVELAQHNTPIACATSGKTSWSQLTSLAPRKCATTAAKVESIGGSVLATMVSPHLARR